MGKGNATSTPERIAVRSDGYGIRVVNERQAIEINRDAIVDLIGSWKFSKPVQEKTPTQKKETSK